MWWYAADLHLITLLSDLHKIPADANENVGATFYCIN